MKLIAIALGAALSIAVVAPAQSQSADPHRISQFIQQHANDFVDDHLSPRQMAEMSVIAFQAATAAVCRDFTVDQDKFVKAFAKLDHEEAGKLSDDQKRYHERHTLVNYGVMLGSFLAEAAPDVAGFCESARKHRNDPEFAKDHLWTAPKP